MKNIYSLTSKAFSATIAISLAIMASLVFVNVLMRYFFHSGLTWAEEVSRFLFMWLIFLGAIVAYKDNEHLGVDSVARRLSVRGKKILYLVNGLIILATMVLLFYGSWQLTVLNTDQSSPAINMPYAYVYASGIVVSIGIGLITIHNLYRLATGQLRDDELVQSTDSEDDVKVAALTEHSADSAQKEKR